VPVPPRWRVSFRPRSGITPRRGRLNYHCHGRGFRGAQKKSSRSRAALPTKDQVGCSDFHCARIASANEHDALDGLLLPDAARKQFGRDDRDAEAEFAIDPFVAAAPRWNRWFAWSWLGFLRHAPKTSARCRRTCVVAKCSRAVRTGTTRAPTR
jgi:hypothetical protein